MRELLTSMFIDNHREGRDLEEDMEEEGEARDMDDENEEESNLVDDQADTEEGAEVVSSKDPQEIARFNNYMDAIYRCAQRIQPHLLITCVHSCNQSLPQMHFHSSTLLPQEDECCSESQVDGPNGPQHERKGGQE